MKLIDLDKLGDCDTCLFYMNNKWCTNAWCDSGEGYKLDYEKVKILGDEVVKHAKWEINCDGYYPYCSNCGQEPSSGKLSPYCPWCGSKMNEEGSFTKEQLKERYKKALEEIGYGRYKEY